MAKKIAGYIKLEIPAGAANPSPPVGPALGQNGLNIMEFCKAFNAATDKIEKGTPIPVLITAYGDRTFSFITKPPPASFFIKKAAGLPKGSTAPGREVAGSITEAQVREIAETNALLDRLGLVLDTDPRHSTQTGQAKPSDDTESTDKEEDEDASEEED